MSPRGGTASAEYVVDDPKPKIGEHKVARYWSVRPVVKMRTPDGGRLRLGPIEKLSPGSACEGSGTRTHQGGDDVVFDFSIRVRHVG
jgi:hypothetical protein